MRIGGTLPRSKLTVPVDRSHAGAAEAVDRLFASYGNPFAEAYGEDWILGSGMAPG